jgi:CDP-diacylglycerol--serine O-phosphatidyltransferase
MNIKKHIPNFLTCCNLLCGCIGIIKAFDDGGFYAGYHYQNLATCSFLIFLACIFDFFDGFVARLLKVSSPIGKELDSLADCVTFGVLPGIIIYQIIMHNFFNGRWVSAPGIYAPYLALLIPVFSAIRLAKFNIDTRQSDSFIGVPTPANAILIASFPFIIIQNKIPFLTSILTNTYCLLTIALIMSFLLIAELPLFALKFKSFKWADNKMRYGFLLASMVLFIFLTWTAIPIIIFLYIILSFIENKLLKPKNSVQINQ